MLFLTLHLLEHPQSASACLLVKDVKNNMLREMKSIGFSTENQHQKQRKIRTRQIRDKCFHALLPFKKKEMSCDYFGEKPMYTS